MKKNVRPFKVWLGPLRIFHKNTIKNCSTVLEIFSSWSLSLSLSLSLSFSLSPLFHKSKDTSAISQPSVHYLVYVFLIFFRFHRCVNNFHSSKNLRTNKLFHWNMLLPIFNSRLTDSPTHQLPTDRLTDPLTTNHPFIHQTYFNRVTIGPILSIINFNSSFRMGIIYYWIRKNIYII